MHWRHGLHPPYILSSSSTYAEKFNSRDAEQGANRSNTSVLREFATP